MRMYNAICNCNCKIDDGPSLVFLAEIESPLKQSRLANNNFFPYFPDGLVTKPGLEESLWANEVLSLFDIAKHKLKSNRSYFANCHKMAF